MAKILVIVVVLVVVVTTPSLKVALGRLGVQKSEKMSEKQIFFRKLSEDSSADASADDLAIINIRYMQHLVHTWPLYE